MTHTTSIIIIYLLGLAVIPTLSCPRQCTCTNAVVDSQRGRIVDCSELYEDVLPEIDTGTLKLDFSSNSLDRIPNRIRQLPELRELNFSHNRIHYDIQNNIFQSNRKLKILDLSNNYISTFRPDALSGLVLLEKLDLHNNLLTTLTSSILLPLPTTTILCLGDNHWDCLCDLPPLLQRFSDAGSNGLLATCRGGTPECTEPSNLYGTTFVDLIDDDVDLCPTTTTTTTTTRPTVPSTTHALTTEVLSTTEETQSSSSSSFFTKNLTNSGDSKVGLITKVSSLEKVPPWHSVGGAFEDKGMMMLIAIVLLGLICSVFSITVLILWKTSAKRRRSRENLSNIATRPESNSPWPLLQSQRSLPVVVPLSNHSSPCDYEEIPFESEAARYTERTCPGAEGKDPEADQLLKVKYSDGSTYVEPIERGAAMNINSMEMTNSPTIRVSSNPFDAAAERGRGNIPSSGDSSYSFAFFSGGLDTSQYIPMHSSVQKSFNQDLYAPMEDTN